MTRTVRNAVFASLIACCVTIASAAPSSPARAAAPPERDRPARLILPSPTGPYPVGTTDLHLIDHARANTWTAGPPYRELMVSLWYPAGGAARYPVAPHMLPGAAANFGSAEGAGTGLYGIPAGSVDFAATTTSGHRGAPVASHRRPFPVVLYSAGAGDPRTWGTTLVQDLASRGFVVVTIDHTYDSSEVQFPDGRVVGSLLERLFQQAQQPGDFQALAARVFDDRVADVRFVLDQLRSAGHGRNPDAEGRPLPAGLTGALDLRRTGMMGVSAGGLTALQAMDADPRVKAGIDLGGAIESPVIPDPLGLWPVARHGLRRPFMVMGDPGTDHHQTPSWKMLWDHSSGWHVDVHLDGAEGENSDKDAVPLIPQIARQLGLPGSYVRSVIGSIDPARAVHTEETFVAAFFDKWLRGGDGDVLDGPSAGFPDVTFVR